MKSLIFIYKYKNKKLLENFLKTYQYNLNYLVIKNGLDFYYYNDFKLNKNIKQNLCELNKIYSFFYCESNFEFNNFFWFYLEFFVLKDNNNEDKFIFFDYYFKRRNKIFIYKHFLNFNFDSISLLTSLDSVFKDYLLKNNNIIYPKNVIIDGFIDIDQNKINILKNNVKKTNFIYSDIMPGWDKINIKDNNFIYEISNYYDIFNEIDSKDIVSFDFFDTLVYRNTLNPEDIFHLLELDYYKKFNTLKHRIINIRKESQTNDEKNDHTHKTYDEIYKTVLEKYKLSNEQVLFLKNREIELEKQYIKLKMFGFYILYYAFKKNKKIIILSDMYLSSSVIKDIFNDLIKNTDVDINKIDFFVSADLKLSKHVGDIYPYIKNRYKSSNIIHIGDNKKSDFENAKNNGLSSFFIPSSYEIAVKNNLINFKEMWLSKSKLFLFFIGNQVSRFFNNPTIVYRQNVNNLIDFNVHFILSFFYLSIFNWMQKQIKSDNKDNSRIYFLSRDGYVFFHFWNIYKKYTKSKIDINYLYYSRKINYLSIFVDDDYFNHYINYFQYDYTTLRTIGVSIGHIKTVKNLFENILGIDEDFCTNNIDCKLSKYEINEFRDLERLRYILKNDYKNIWNHLLNVRNEIKNYYKNLILKPYDKNYIFDSGSLNNDRLFFEILNIPFSAFYLYRKNENNYVYDNIYKTKTFCYFNYETKIIWQLLEYLIHDVNNPSLKSIKDGNPVFCKYKNLDWTKFSIAFIQNLSFDNFENFISVFFHHYEYFYSHSFFDQEIFLQKYEDLTFLKNDFLIGNIHINDDIYDSRNFKIFNKKVNEKNFLIKYMNYRIQFYLNPNNFFIKTSISILKTVLKLKNKILKK